MMEISFDSQNDFSVNNEEEFSGWIVNVAKAEGRDVGVLGYIFCSDEYLLKMNQDYLNHDTLTDIITFDYSSEEAIEGEIYISTERVMENANEFRIDFEQELARVIIHGVLHLCGYRDKTDQEQKVMTQKEDEALFLFNG